MKYFKKLIGERIYLSPLCVDDAETFVKWMNDRSVSDGIRSTSKMINVESEKNWIISKLERGDFNFAIVLKDSDKLIGSCGIDSVDGINQTATVGIFLGEEFERNKGYGAEALKLLLDFGFNMLNLNNISLGVFSFNERAINCYKKIGFKEYGRRSECYYLDGKFYDEILMEYLKRDFIK